MAIRQISAPELAELIKQSGAELQLLDVREAWEAALARIPDSTLIPMGQVPARVFELDRTKPVACICHHGMRSMQVAYFLENQGFNQVLNLTGGIDAWSKLVDSSCATY